MATRWLLQDGSSTIGENEGELEPIKAWGIFIQLGMLVAAFLIAFAMRMNPGHFFSRYLSEAGCALLLGCIAGFVLDKIAPDTLESVVSFDREFFFLFLLPPIIFDSGYRMKRKKFFVNFGAILLYAFLGTFLSSIIVGFIVYLFGWYGIIHPLSLLESLIFGALISATDPVTILSVFQTLNVDLNLYSLVFGESVLNDAVAIVLYRTLIVYIDHPVTVSTIFAGIGLFLLIFIGSFMIGLIFAVILALLTKNTNISKTTSIEVSMVILIAFMSYMIAEGLKFSGIVAILFCGIFSAHYALNNMSKRGAEVSVEVFHILAFLSETFVFIYLGAAMFTKHQDYHWGLIAIALVALFVARACHIFPFAYMVNQSRHESFHIPFKNQFVMWYSGLRGAIAFALSLEVSTENARVILTTTLFVVFFTVLVLGGGIQSVLDYFKIYREGVDAPSTPVPADGDTPTRRRSSDREHFFGGNTMDLFYRPVRAFVKFDRKFFKSWLTNYRGPHAEDGEGGQEMDALEEEDDDEPQGPDTPPPISRASLEFTDTESIHSNTVVPSTTL
eukprot:TRINITY_DN11863_c2_g1_i1.p1 TRINITY_DN11863_c2_g1~~TRINITY_DN11863_c2_g1_i1.p1  ORF type:complete len:568 (-),score=120.96 TRINITY_DN11863_c2_g1_i1:66-1742(-)